MSARKGRKKKQRSPEKHNSSRDAKTRTYPNRCPPEPAGSGEPALEQMTRPKRSGERWTASSGADQRQLQMPNQNKKSNVQSQQVASEMERIRIQNPSDSITKGRCRNSPGPKGRLPLTGRPALTRRAAKKPRQKEIGAAHQATKAGCP